MKKNNVSKNKPVEGSIIENATLTRVVNTGHPSVLFMPDPETGNYIEINLDNPSEEAVELLIKIINKFNNKSGAV